MKEMTARNKNIPALRFKGFEGQATTKSLDDIVNVIDCKHRTPQYVETGVPVVSPGSIKWGDIDLISPTKRVTENEYNSLMDHCEPKKGDLVFSRNQSIGVASVIYNDDKFVLGQDTVLIQPKKINSIYNYYRLQTDSVQLHISKLSGGSTFSRINLKDLRKLKVTIVDNAAEQQKIASFLSAIDEKIRQLTHRKELLEQYKKGVMQQLFSGKLRFKDEKGKAFPKWEEKKLDEVCDCLDNMRKPLNDAERQTMQGTIPYWGANNIMDYVNDYLFDETIVLLAEDGGNFNEYKTRPIANLSRGKCWVNNHTHVLKGKKGLINEFLFYSLVHKNITGFVSGGTRAKLTKGQMLKIRIGLPSLKEQEKIASFLSSLDTKIENVGAQIERTQRYKKGLFQQMFV